MRVVELFCGAGGMSLGLREAGLDVIAAYDAWSVAVDNYNRNLGNYAKTADLSNILQITPELLDLAPDMICGGPPCQDYSSSGRRQEAENAKLTLAFAILISTVRPQWFMMENVARAAKSATWQHARRVLKAAGYGLTEKVLNASLYGVPQSRKRLFVVGRLGERDGFLASAIAAAASSKPMTLRDMLGPSVPEAIYFPARSNARRSVWGPDEPAPTIRERNIRKLPVTYQPHPEDAAVLANGFIYARPTRAGRGVRSIDEPYPTVTRTASERPAAKYLSAPHPDDPIAASDSAVLSIHQISRIQGFADWWEWKAKAKRDIYQMIANAVPAPVARTLGRLILQRQKGQSAPAIEGNFLDWLVRRGRGRQSARNVKHLAGRARMMLGGRTFANQALERAALEANPQFQSLSKNAQSDLRQALRLLAEYQNRHRPSTERSNVGDDAAKDREAA